MQALDECLDQSRLLEARPTLWTTLMADLGGPERVISDPQLFDDFVHRASTAWRCLTEPIPGRGISARRVGELVGDALVAEFDSWEFDGAPVGDDEAPRGWRRRRGEPVFNAGFVPVSPQCRGVITGLWLRGFDPPCIDYVFCPPLPVGTTERTLRRHPPHVKGREIVALHLEGMAVAGIVRATKAPTTSVIRCIRMIGDVPNPAERVKRQPGLTKTVIKLHNQGVPHEEIAKRLGLTHHAVRGRLKRARKQGRVSGYRQQAPQYRRAAE